MLRGLKQPTKAGQESRQTNRAECGNGSHGGVERVVCGSGLLDAGFFPLERCRCDSFLFNGGSDRLLYHCRRGLLFYGCSRFGNSHARRCGLGRHRDRDGGGVLRSAALAGGTASFIVGEAAGLGGRLMRTVCFLDSCEPPAAGGWVVSSGIVQKFKRPQILWMRFDRVKCLKKANRLPKVSPIPVRL